MMTTGRRSFTLRTYSASWLDLDGLTPLTAIVRARSAAHAKRRLCRNLWGTKRARRGAQLLIGRHVETEQS